MKTAAPLCRKVAGAILLAGAAVLLLLMFLNLFPKAISDSYDNRQCHVEITPLPGLPEDWLLNSADAEALDALPGVGEVIAQRIIDAREQDGLFFFPEDILTVKGIGDKRFADIMTWLEENPDMERWTGE